MHPLTSDVEFICVFKDILNDPCKNSSSKVRHLMAGCLLGAQRSLRYLES